MNDEFGMPDRVTETMLSKVAEGVSPESLTEDEWLAVDYLNSDRYFFKRRRDNPERPTVVAEGDSWFRLPWKHEIIHYLKKRDGFNVYGKLAHHGDDLASMVYGPRQVGPTKDAVRRYLRDSNKKVFLFSAGGNDVAGPELKTLLRHRETLRNPPQGALHEGKVDLLIKDLRSHFEAYFRTMSAEAGAGLHMISHGYGHVRPDGRAYKFGLFRTGMPGPWLAPSLKTRGFEGETTLDEGRQITSLLIETFNAMLAGLSEEYTEVTDGDMEKFSFHYEDLTEILPADSGTDVWADEIHPRAKTFQTIAGLFARRINEILDSR